MAKKSNWELIVTNCETCSREPQCRVWDWNGSQCLSCMFLRRCLICPSYLVVSVIWNITAFLFGCQSCPCAEENLLASSSFSDFCFHWFIQIIDLPSHMCQNLEGLFEAETGLDHLVTTKTYEHGTYNLLIRKLMTSFMSRVKRKKLREPTWTTSATSKSTICKTNCPAKLFLVSGRAAFSCDWQQTSPLRLAKQVDKRTGICQKDKCNKCKQELFQVELSSREELLPAISIERAIIQALEDPVLYKLTVCVNEYHSTIIHNTCICGISRPRSSNSLPKAYA